MLDELRSVAEGFGFKLYSDDAAMAEALGAEYIPVERFGETVDVVLAMGGDGTVLYTSRMLYGSDVPIMGINLGSLGFLTSVGDADIFQGL